MIRQVTVKLLRSDRKVENLALHFTDSPPCFIEVQGPPSKKYPARDLFDALKKLRLDLEKDGARLLCNGSRTNCYPSAMSRAMTGGRQLYVLEKGRAATDKNCVDIFGEASAETVGTVADQEAFFQKWSSSPRR